jgi:DNA-binding CsgD family transcriptional regulator/tetratricopeptide (TPR) repeat protein
MAPRAVSPVLVGRRTELAALELALSRAGHSTPSLTLLSGEAGVGKTRLARELERLARERGMTVLKGQCLELQGGEFPYAPIVAALRDAWDDGLEEPLAVLSREARAELARLVPQLGPTGEDTSVEGAGTQFARIRLFESLRGLLRELSQRSPVLFLIEDAHWADTSTRDFLAFIVRNFSGTGIALVVTYRLDEVTYRSDELARVHPLRGLIAELKRCDGVSELELECLTEEELEQMLERILGLAPDEELVEEMFRRSGGNPFFAEELLAARVAGEREELPRSLRDALLLRVERFSGETLEVLRTLAVLGRPARQELLASLAAIDERALSRALRVAVDLGVLCCRATDEAFDFQHALLREAVCTELLPGERRALHTSIAQVLERTGQANAAELAHHWQGAGDGRAALVASIDAGLEAERVYAFAEAREHFNRALRLWDGSTASSASLKLDHPALLARAAEMTGLTGDWDRAFELGGQALELIDPAAEPLRAATFYERLGEYHFWDDEAALACFEEALRLLPAECRAERARLLGAEGLELHYMGRWEEARNRSEEGLELAREARAAAEEGYARTVLGTALAFLGDPGAGEAHVREGLRIAEELGRAEDLVRAYAHLAEVLRLDGRLAEALALMLEGEETAARFGMSKSFGRSLSVNAAEDLFRLGRWDEAAARLRRTARLKLRFAAELLHHLLVGQLSVARGDFQQASSSLQRAREMCSPGVDADFLVGVHAAWAELALWEGRPEDAREEVQQALGALDGPGDPLYAPMLYSLGVRAEADVAEQVRPLRREAECDRARETAETLLRGLDQLIERHSLKKPSAEALAHRALAQAEFGRLVGRPDPRLWSAAAQRWESLEQLYPAAYARWREAESLPGAARRAKAAAPLRVAHETAALLGAEPLVDGIERLARVANLSLSSPETPTVNREPSAQEQLGLTGRELEVLALVAKGLTDRQISERLFIGRKTVGSHVSHILAKLSVSNRVAAAGVAIRLGLVDSRVPERLP